MGNGTTTQLLRATRARRRSKLNHDVHPGGKVELPQFIDRFGRGLDDAN